MCLDERQKETVAGRPSRKFLFLKNTTKPPIASVLRLGWRNPTAVTLLTLYYCIFKQHWPDAAQPLAWPHNHLILARASELLSGSILIKYSVHSVAHVGECDLLCPESIPEGASSVSARERDISGWVSSVVSFTAPHPLDRLSPCFCSARCWMDCVGHLHHHSYCHVLLAHQQAPPMVYQRTFSLALFS